VSSLQLSSRIPKTLYLLNFIVDSTIDGSSIAVRESAVSRRAIRRTAPAGPVWDRLTTCLRAGIRRSVRLRPEERYAE
jgi:hypothetical protein